MILLIKSGKIGNLMMRTFLNDISIDDLESLSDEELQDRIDKLVPKNPWEKS